MKAKEKTILYRQKELLRITLESIGQGIVATNKEGRISLLNKSAQAITGWRDTEAKGRRFTEVFALKDEGSGAGPRDPIRKALETGKDVSLAGDEALVHKQGFSVPIAGCAAPIRDERGSIFGAVMIFRDASRDRRQQEHIVDLSYHDFLTGLYNRRFVSENKRRLDTAANLPLAVIIGDVNGLKLTNDAFGHMAGDRLLKKVAGSIKESCRKEDIVIRWGGDEFLVLLPKATVKTAEEAIQRMQKNFARNSDGTLQISVSLGYGVKESSGENLQDILRTAEKWMYHKKLLEGKSHRKNIIGTLLTMLYENNIDTERHSKRLEIYCRRIGEKLGLSGEEQNELSLFAMLHDIGMVAIPQNITKKRGPLTPGEREEIRRHCEIGYRIVQNTPEMSAISQYILLHHERWDGKGYPRGCKEKEIPLLCRILAVADAYDAMTVDQTYRKACSKEEAIEEIKRNAGVQFDPEIVGLFAGIIENGQLPAGLGS
ncbi:MAG: diguanylate cyclase [Peptococcaceae bacterium]|nr:diguanylate cyclase [Peptococcaceae bacterium]